MNLEFKLYFYITHIPYYPFKNGSYLYEFHPIAGSCIRICIYGFIGFMAIGRRGIGGSAFWLEFGIVQGFPSGI